MQRKFKKYLRESQGKEYHNIKVGDKIDTKENRYIGKPGTTRTLEGKLKPKWRGPYTVLRVNASGTSFEVARIKDEAKTPTFWVNIRNVRRTTAEEPTPIVRVTRKARGPKINQDGIVERDIDLQDLNDSDDELNNKDASFKL